LGFEQTLPALRQLEKSPKVSNMMQKDARLAIDMIEQRMHNEKMELNKQGERGDKKNFAVLELGGPSDVKMNPFFVPEDFPQAKPVAPNISIEDDIPEKPEETETFRERPTGLRIWTSLEGWFTLDAVLVKKDNKQVVLSRDKDGKEITVPIERLSSRSRKRC
jgi:hypothetical protein